MIRPALHARSAARSHPEGTRQRPRGRRAAIGRVAPRRRLTALALALGLALGGGAVAGVGAVSAEKAKSSEKAKGAKSERPRTAEPSDEPIGLYAMTFARALDKLVVTHYWAKGPLFRAESVVRGHPLVTLVSGDYYYTLDPSMAIGVAIRRAPEVVALDASRGRAFATEYQDIVAEGGEKIREEQVAGTPVEVYRVTDDVGRRTLWVTPTQLRLPVRVETFSRKTSETSQLDYVNWLVGFPLRDEFFEPPPNIKLQRFESYEAYLKHTQEEGPVPPAPPLYRHLLVPPGAD